MIAVCDAIHRVLTVGFEQLWYLMSIFSDYLQLITVSAVFGFVMVALFGLVSNQRLLKKVKGDISALLIESFIFRYEIKSALSAQAKLFLSGVKYLLLATAPVLILLLPFAFLLSQMNARFGYSNESPAGESAVRLQMRVKDSAKLKTLYLAGDPVPEHLGPVRSTKDKSAEWMIKPGSQFDSIAVKDSTGEVLLAAPLLKSAGSNQVPYLRYGPSSSVLDAILYPRRAPGLNVQPDVIESVALLYPERVFSFLGIAVSWLIPFFVISMISGYISSKIMKVSV